MNYRLEKTKGFTVIEILIALAVLVLIASFSYATFVSLSKAQVLEKDVSALIALLEEAKSNTRSSIDASRYGVYLDEAENKAVLFKGTEYDDASPTNLQDEITFNSNVYISSIVLAEEGGSTDSDIAVFNRPKGDTYNHGTVTLSLADDSESITVAIYPTGSIEVLP